MLTVLLNVECRVIHGSLKDTVKYDNLIISQTHVIKDLFPAVLNIIPIANYLECYDRFLCVEMSQIFHVYCWIVV